MKPVCGAASLLPPPRVSRCTWGWLPFCPVPTPAVRLSLGSPGPVSVEGGRKGPWGLGGKVFVPSGGASPRIYDPNLYSAHRGSKCLLYCYVHIHIWGCKYSCSVYK